MEVRRQHQQDLEYHGTQEPGALSSRPERGGKNGDWSWGLGIKALEDLRLAKFNSAIRPSMRWIVF